ncbi:2Fe-2S iron-sulfur cluster binding domain-containing protein [Bradyrhizobium sp. 193]|uniref:2Fe-2S iron-sulfur cluster-binding protein n=1 Tax=Bradyrhizobium sp. 193 TaxID=2782661 RepID=UPI001FFA16B9|nr:2Fe-2S iron-sulfur cluster-binding protein [Bradyrhizobium sp. 193]MCK1487756.1 2Fe-2S iron-sulfur cluster binding domain-containing protein [Bradyrhizobium sp. 193]
MTRINYVAANSTRVSFDIENGTSVMQGAVLSGVDGIVGECGGSAMCATCHIYVAIEQAGLPAWAIPKGGPSEIRRRELVVR